MTPRTKSDIQNSRLLSLFKAWGLVHRNKNRLYAKTTPRACDPNAHSSFAQKLNRWLEQIGILERKELDIISQINHIERKHKALRKEKKLLRAKPRPDKSIDDNDEEKPKNRFWFWFILFLLFCSGKRRSDAPTNG